MSFFLMLNFFVMKLSSVLSQAKVFFFDKTFSFTCKNRLRASLILSLLTIAVHALQVTLGDYIG